MAKKKKIIDQTRVEPKKKSGKKSKVKKRQPCFIMVEGDYLGEIFPLKQSLTAIGRSEECDIILTDPGISRTHAKVIEEKKGHILQDLNSTNGTYVNGRQVENYELLDGDKVAIGSIVLKYCYQDEIDVNYHKKLRSLAIKDGLTKIYNKQHFDEVLKREFAYSQRHEHTFCLVLIDIDHFKKVNDNLGHQAGDYILRNLAKVLSAEVREYDTFARFGGEEFIFLLRNVNLENAVVFAERIRRRVANTPFVFQGNPKKITISLGVAFFDGEDKSIKNAGQLLKQADEYLYTAKEKGRNRVSSVLYQ